MMNRKQFIQNIEENKGTTSLEFRSKHRKLDGKNKRTCKLK